MRPRRLFLPLYAKILAWFFLNLLLLAAGFVLLFDAQFSFNLDWFLASGARARIEAVRDLIVGELNTTSPDEWPAVLERYSTAHRVPLALLDEAANPFVGDLAGIPDEVRARILARPPAKSAATSRLPLRTLLRTANPTQYWLLTSARVDNLLAGDPLNVILVARSPSISGGGLISDPTPWLAVGAGAVGFSLLFWFPLVRGITQSVSRMRDATRAIADGRFDVRTHLRRRDELGSLAESIDGMAARLDGLVSGQKRFLGDIAHELCSPLSRLQMALGILEQRATDGQAAYVRSATEKAAQISSLVNELLSFSKASFGAAAVHLQSVPVLAAAQEALRRETRENVPIHLDVPADLLVAADPDLLIRALANLLRNATRHAANSPAPITLTAARDADGMVSIRVTDTGPGVPGEELPRIFDAFYRVDPSRTRESGGIGLGLTIVKTCVESCGGTVTARNRQPHGLEVQVRLPAGDRLEA